MRNPDFSTAPKMYANKSVIDFGEHPLGTQTEIDYVIANNGSSKLTIGYGELGAKLNGQAMNSYVPFYYTSETNPQVNSPIEVAPNSQATVKLYFDLKDAPVSKGEYEGYFLELPTNDPINSWLTINVKGKAI
jgi:hypothetical protein